MDHNHVSPSFSLRTLIIDNYDSYTYNLLQLWEFADEETDQSKSPLSNVVVIRNDQFEWNEFKNNILPHFDNIIISPGPGSPENASDFAICRDVLKLENIPILGVCLGHQGIGIAYGAKVIPAKRIIHGQLSLIHHNGMNSVMSLFSGIPSPFWAVRYHSLVVDCQDLPSALMTTAWSSEEAVCDKTFLSTKETETFPNGTIDIMGLQHAYKPIYGVQFHPESISTEYGPQILRNFLRISTTYLKKIRKSNSFQKLPSHIACLSAFPTCPIIPKEIFVSLNVPKYQLIFKKLDSDIWIDCETVFQNYLSSDTSLGTWWLDSARQPDPQSRFTFMGSTPSIANSFSVSYWTSSKRIKITCSNGKVISKVLSGGQTFWDWMSFTMEHFNKCISGQLIIGDSRSSDQACSEVPFGFRLGMVGYLGYEMKYESLPGYTTPSRQQYQISINQPDAAFIFSTQAIIFDHLDKRVWLAGLVQSGNNYKPVISENLNSELSMTTGFSHSDFSEWINATEKQFRLLKEKFLFRPSLIMNSINRRDIGYRNMSSGDLTNFKKSLNIGTKPTNQIPRPVSPITNPFVSDLDSNSYINAINRARSLIFNGQSYEICLTTQFRTTLPSRLDNPLDLYRQLRKKNPAPFSALLDFSVENLAVLSSSPEKFVEVTHDGVVEMKPIKGTVAVASGCCCKDIENCDGSAKCEKNRQKEDALRMKSLACDIKERAENLMIVDLIRHDLAHICLPHTIRVPLLMKVESYKTMHQLVTTVCGQLKKDFNCVQAVRGCFPPGSMTGAPKLRSVQILDDLEDQMPRGIYSGCLGYFSFQDGKMGRNQGSAMFSVVIRTAVVFGGTELSIGAGGAITYPSDPDAEWREMLLKSQSVVPSVLAYLNQEDEKHELI
ncbi:hypothetical protein G9A89_005815 [Geosiphon pyriformis]|nr:hypothetical protein G9A89_005815 [Geosiphon pyriformis]